MLPSRNQHRSRGLPEAAGRGVKTSTVARTLPLMSVPPTSKTSPEASFANAYDDRPSAVIWPGVREKPNGIGVMPGTAVAVGVEVGAGVVLGVAVRVGPDVVPSPELVQAAPAVMKAAITTSFNQS